MREIIRVAYNIPPFSDKEEDESVPIGFYDGEVDK